MSEEQIKQAFEGRWRIKGSFEKVYQNTFPLDFNGIYDYFKGLCFDFFRTGVAIGVGEDVQDVQIVCGKNFIPYLSKALEDSNNDFDVFWNLYDKKVGRPKCEKLWNKLTIEEKNACIDYLPHYKLAQPDKQYRKNPETFLRNKSWNDELIYRNNGNQPNDNGESKLAAILTP